MMSSRSLLSLRGNLTSYARSIATKSKFKLVGDIDESVSREAAQEGFSGKTHPGRIHNPVSELPAPLQKAIFKVLTNAEIKTLKTESETFNRQLRARFEPSKSNSNRKWTSKDYNEHLSRVYLLARMAPEFAVMNRVFGEFSKWLPNFTPKTLFDFGSGVGSVSWAAYRAWGKRLEEIYCVDSSSDMINLSEILMKGGDQGGHFDISQTYFRQFMPATSNRTYDLVVSAHSLFEFPTLEARLDAHYKLWSKVNNYLVLVEQGTSEGFKLIDEAKEFILFTARKEGTRVHILAPCPHLEACPRLQREGDRTPCNFETRYIPFPENRNSQACTERFSFVIIGKGPRPSSLPQWPRIVRHPLVRTQHTVCRLCTPDAKLEEVIFSRSKDGNASYLCARSSEWGDVLPVNVHSKEFIVREKAKKDAKKEELDSEVSSSVNENDNTK